MRARVAFCGSFCRLPPARSSHGRATVIRCVLCKIHTASGRGVGETGISSYHRSISCGGGERCWRVVRLKICRPERSVPKNKTQRTINAGAERDEDHSIHTELIHTHTHSQKKCEKRNRFDIFICAPIKNMDEQRVSSLRALARSQVCVSSGMHAHHTYDDV